MRSCGIAAHALACAAALTPSEASAVEAGADPAEVELDPEADLEVGAGVGLWGIGGSVGVGLSPIEGFRWVSRLTATGFLIDTSQGGDVVGYASLSSGLELGLFEETFALFAGAEAALLYLGASDFVVPSEDVVAGAGVGPVFGVHVPIPPLAEGFGIALEVPLIFTAPLDVEGSLDAAVARGPHLVPAPRLFARQRF
jgi:hypothetical protein